ncbi:MAG: hypothetical protein ACJAS9_001427 [Polaribacter sp.]|jgi:hypothetical protein
MRSYSDLSVSVKGETKGEQERTITNKTQLTRLLPEFKMNSFQFGIFSEKISSYNVSLN